MRFRNTLEIHQILPSFAPRDAIGFHTLEMQRMIRSLGIDSTIYADEIKEGMHRHAEPFSAFARKSYRPNSYLIYQASTGSPIVSTLVNRREPVVINFHNITPKEILGRWDIGVGIVVGAGVKQLSALGKRSLGAVSVSKYNKWSLEQEGITENSFVAAPFIPLASARKTLHEPTREVRKDTSNWLFVGRIAPNKAQHDIVKAFAAFVKGWNPAAKLTLVGSVSSAPYAQTLKRLITELDLEDRVAIVGPLDEPALEDEYRKATVFVSMSDHEGFGFPLIEALNHSLPVVAFGSSAIPETLGRSGIVLTRKDPLHVAAAVALVEKDTALRRSTAGNARLSLAAYSPERAKRENLEALAALIPEMTDYL